MRISIHADKIIIHLQIGLENAIFLKLECPRYDTFGVVVPVLEEWGVMPLLSLLPGPLWPRLVVSVRVISMSQVDLFEIMFKMILNYICSYEVFICLN